MGEKCRRQQDSLAVVGVDRELPCAEKRRRDTESELADSDYNRSQNRRRAMMMTESVSCCSSVYLLADRSTTYNPTEEEMETSQRETLTFSGATNSGESDMVTQSITFSEPASLTKEKSMLSKTEIEIEMDEWLTAAENDLLKSFQEKYNFDFAKGVPVKGPYEWAPVKP